MNLRSIVRLLPLWGVLMLLAAPAAHAAPPKGDMIANPISIALNASKTVKNVHEATEEPSVDNVSPCDVGGTVKDSVWFAFTLPFDATVDFFTKGSVVIADTWVSFPLIGVFSYDIGTGLTHAACAQSGNLYAVNLVAGEYRILMGHTTGSFATMGPESRYKLTLRATAAGLSRNGDFDDPIAGTWKIKKAGDPPNVYQNCPIPTDCEIRFNGAAKGQISQNVIIPPTKQFKFVDGDLIQMLVYINSTQPAGSNVKSKLMVTYSDGTPTTSVTVIGLVVHTSTSGFTQRYQIAEIQSAAVKSIKVSVSSPTAADTFTMDFLPLTLFSGSPRSAALPLPPTP